MQGQRQIPTTPTHSFKQLSEQSGIQFGTVQMGSTYRYFTEAKDEVDRKIGEHLKDNPNQLVKSTEEGIKRVRTSNGQYAFIMEELSARQYVGQLPCDLMLIHHSFIRKSYAFGCANANVCRNIDVAIIKLKNDGEIRELTDKWMENDGGCDTDFYDDYLEYITSFNSKKDASGYLFQSNALSMEKVGSMFILLAIGIVVGVGLLIFDICTERKVQVSNIRTFSIIFIKQKKLHSSLDREFPFWRIAFKALLSLSQKGVRLSGRASDGCVLIIFTYIILRRRRR